MTHGLSRNLPTAPLLRPLAVDVNASDAVVHAIRPICKIELRSNDVLELYANVGLLLLTAVVEVPSARARGVNYLIDRRPDAHAKCLRETGLRLEPVRHPI
jgi:hypothetical protein